MQSKKVENGYILRLAKGEELLEKLKEFCVDNNVVSGWLSGLGSTDHIKLAYYDIEKKEYIAKEFPGPLEVTNITGNIARKDGETVFHVHATVGREDYTAVAGHVDHLRVGATLEVFIQPFSELLIRKKDEEIELNLLDLQ